MDDLEVLPEAALLAAARRGDPSAFERLVAGYRGGWTPTSTGCSGRCRTPRTPSNRAPEVVAA